MNFVLLFFSYLVGSIPCGLLLGKSIGVDVRKSGSGNIGATNVNRLLGKKLGLLTLVGDMLKAIVPMAVTGWLLDSQVDEKAWVALAGGAAFLGHIFPIYLKFKGGKGVATALGVFLFIKPLAALSAVAVFVAAVAASGYVSVGSLAAAAAMPFILILMQGASQYILLAFFIALLIWAKHKENIGRLIRHEEKSWKTVSGPRENR